MPRPIVIVHFQPLELYPPDMNLLSYLEAQPEMPQVIVFSTRPVKEMELFVPSTKKISIKRSAQISSQLAAAKRYLNYVLFYTKTLLGIISCRPLAILYFETLSAYPVYLYKKFISRKTPVLIHYHEYMSPQEYRTGMKLVKFIHAKEKELYPSAHWISHTNEERAAMFVSDEGLSDTATISVLPNYPSCKWLRQPSPAAKLPVRAVYVGALSMDTMYTENFCKWLITLDGLVTLDVYSFNITNEAQQFIKGLQCEWIRLHDGVNYSSLPGVLKQYDVGIILYSGHIPNYVHNAPNKLFEYMICGLDVWFPQVMQGTMKYANADSFPKVIPLDFENLSSFSVQHAIDKTGCAYRQPAYCFENILPALAGRLLNRA